VPDAYEFLSTKTIIQVDGMQVLSPVVVDDDVTAGKSAEYCSDTAAADAAFMPVSLGLITKRPSDSGVKAAKAAKAARRAKSRGGQEDKADEMTALLTAVSDLGSSRSAEMAERDAVAARQVALGDAAIRLKTFQALYGQGSSASNEERKAAEDALRLNFAQSILAVPQQQLANPALATTTARATPAHAVQTTAAVGLTSSLPVGNGTVGIRLNLSDSDEDDGDA
jgi:hypothetical protein